MNLEFSGQMRVLKFPTAQAPLPRGSQPNDANPPSLNKIGMLKRFDKRAVRSDLDENEPMGRLCRKQPQGVSEEPIKFRGANNF